MATQLEPDLAQVIESLYRRFAYHRASFQCYCTCCVTPEDIRRLMSKRLRELSGEDLEQYVRKAMTTWGDVEDFKHFLPRIVELFLCGSRQIESYEVAVKLKEAQWLEWPREECEVVLDAWDVAWRTLLKSGSSRAYASAFRFLKDISEFEPDISRWLKLWTDQEGYWPRWHLADFINDFLGEMWRNKVSPSLPQIAEWLRLPTIQDYFDAALLDDQADDFVANTSMVLAELRARPTVFTR